MSDDSKDAAEFAGLLAYLRRVPAIEPSIGTGYSDGGRWWVKFAIDIQHPLAWRVVQEFGHVLNYMSIEEKLPTVFMPVSPPPYLNGGPHDYLSWLIESRTVDFKPDACAEWLDGRLPRPVTDANAWSVDDDDSDYDDDDYGDDDSSSGWLHRLKTKAARLGRSIASVLSMKR